MPLGLVLLPSGPRQGRPRARHRRVPRVARGDLYIGRSGCRRRPAAGRTVPVVRHSGSVEITRARPPHAHLVGRLLFDFNTEFDTSGPTAEEFAGRFVTLLKSPDVLACSPARSPRPRASRC